MAEAGAVCSFDGSCYVVTEYEDPATGQAWVFVPFVAPAVLRCARRLGELVDRLRAGHSREVLLRADAGFAAAIAAAGFRPYQRYLLSPAEPIPGPGRYEVRAARAEDAPFVADLLARALVAAYADEGVAVDRAAADRLVADRFGQEAGGGVRSWVAVDGGMPVGHVTAAWPVTDEVTGRQLVELVDVMWVDGAAGCRDDLVHCVLAAATRLGLPVLGQVSGGGDREGRVHRGLAGAGWRPWYDLWVRATEDGTGR